MVFLLFVFIAFPFLHAISKFLARKKKRPGVFFHSESVVIWVPCVSVIRKNPITKTCIAKNKRICHSEIHTKTYKHNGQTNRLNLTMKLKRPRVFLFLPHPRTGITKNDECILVNCVSHVESKTWRDMFISCSQKCKVRICRIGTLRWFDWIVGTECWKDKLKREGNRVFICIQESVDDLI